MVSGNSRKNVPEWLNSSLWSSSPSISPPARWSPQTEEEKGKELQATESDYGRSVCKNGASGSEIRGHDQGSDAKEIMENGVVAMDERIQFEFDRIEVKSEEAGRSEEGEGESNMDPSENEVSEVWPPDEFSSEPIQFSLPAIPGHSTPPRASLPTFKRCSSFDSRVGQFISELSRKLISIPELQRLSSQGIPDTGSIRATTWKLLLGYLPKSRALWSAELDKKHSEYAIFREELLVTPTEVTRRKEGEASGVLSQDSEGPLQRHEITHEDHPLSLGKTSVWHQFFVDSEIFEQIDRDVKRTHPDMQFFCGDSASSIENQEAMKRALFIFAKLNPGIRYVQGMNEVLAPLFYVFKTDPDEMNAANAEADAFFCFVELLSDFRDHFCQQLDNSAVGIRSTIARLAALLKRQDEELWRHLEVTSKVNPQFYAFRWITLLLTQEFNFPDSLRLWDSLLSNPDGPLEILLRVCCAMLMSIRSRLLAGDFTSNLKLLQHYPSVDIHHLLRLADELKVRNLE